MVVNKDYLYHKLTATTHARWCNGNTRDFDSLILGSSPSRAADYVEIIFLLLIDECWQIDSIVAMQL